MGKFFDGLFKDLRLYVRQAAWLHTAPLSKDGSPQLSRLAQLQRARRDATFHPEMPHVDASHVLGYLFEIGPVLPGGMGPVPLTHTELLAWQQNVGIELQAWEARCLLQLSREYSAQAALAQSSACKPPWEAANSLQKQNAAANMKSAIKRMVH